MLEEHCCHARQEHHDQESITKLRASSNIGSPVAWVHVPTKARIISKISKHLAVSVAAVVCCGAQYHLSVEKDRSLPNSDEKTDTNIGTPLSPPWSISGWNPHCTVAFLQRDGGADLAPASE